jgi:hypothetical protein
MAQTATFSLSQPGRLNEVPGLIFFKDSRSRRYPANLGTNSPRHHSVFEFLSAARFADPIVSLPPCQFAREMQWRESIYDEREALPPSVYQFVIENPVDYH